MPQKATTLPSWMQRIKTSLRSAVPRSRIRSSIFLRMPRTGTTSISLLKLPNSRVFGGESEGFWGNQSPPHRFPRLWQCVADKMGERAWEDSFKFAAVRNPWDRAISMWKHAFAGALTFEELCSKIASNDMTPELRWHTQEVCFHISDDEGRFVVDHVMRFERLQEEMDHVCDSIGIHRVKLPHSNKSSRGHYTTYYTEYTRQLVADIYRADIDAFGYVFGE